MARHRNVRNRKYSDDYYDYEDEFGQSVEEEHLPLGETDHYIYNRSGNRHAISNFLTPCDDVLEDAVIIAHPTLDRRDSINLPSLTLSENDEAKLLSCLDKIRNVLDDTIAEGTIIETILRHNFDADKALDDILTKSNQNTSTIQDNIMPLPATQPTLPPVDKSYKIKPLTEPAEPVGVVRGFKVGKDLNLEINNLHTSRDQSPASERLQSKIDQPGDSKVGIKIKENKIDPTIQYTKERGSDKDHLYIVVIGHVDAGKSTLMGRLLCEVGEISQKILHKYEQESKKIGKQSFMYAWVLDETGEERLRGITMDVGRAQFETKTKRIIILDAPGHADFIPNMITGAGQADVALMVVDATRGEFESGFDLGGQTREHALLVRSLGVNQLAVAVNKLDTNNWSQERFVEIKNKLKIFLKQAGFKDSDVTFVPCSGLNGENLVKSPSEPELLKWYKGPCLLDVIDKFNVPDRPVSKPLRMSINDIFKGMGSGFCVAGRVENGVLNKGDKVLVCPTKEMAEVKNLSINDLSSNVAFAGDQVSVTLSGIDMQNVSVGYILSDPVQQVPVASRFEARLVVFNVKVPITKGYPVLIHHQSLVESANIVKLKALLNKSTGEILKKKPRCLGNNSVAVVDIEVCRPICIQRYKDVKELGRVMLRVSGVTIAAGLVMDIFTD